MQNHITPAIQTVDVEDLGRRIYVQEQCLARDGLLSEDRCAEMLRCAVSLSVPRAYAHAASEIEMWQGETVRLSADDLAGKLGFRALQTSYFGSITVKSNNNDSYNILEPDEAIVANCYFSNYYTLASSEESAGVMFADNSSISNIRDLKPGRLLLVTPKMLCNRPNKSEFLRWLSDFDANDVTKTVVNDAVEEVASSNDKNHHEPLVNSIVENANRLIGRMTTILHSTAKDL